MWNLSKGGAKEQTVQEAEEQEPRNSQEPWLMFYIGNLECNHGGCDEHDRGHCKSGTESGKRIGGNVSHTNPYA
jgi:hypothetical protein